jgi:hypothetical protein
MSNETTAVAVVNPIASQLEAASQLGTWMAKSGLFGCNNVENGQILAMTCLTERITPMEYLNTYDTVQGRPRMKSDAMLAKFVMAGGTYDVLKREADVCEVKFVWKEKEVTFSYTLGEAKTAKIVRSGGTWETHPKNMLFARCVSNYLRTYVPELFAGHYSAEEMREDIPVAPPVQVQPLFADPKPANDLSKPQEERMDVEILKPEGKEVSNKVLTPKAKSKIVDVEAEEIVDEAKPEPEPEPEPKAEKQDESSPDFGWSNCLVINAIDLRMALDWLAGNDWVSESDYKKIKPSSKATAIAKAINTISDEHKETIENGIDRFGKAVVKLNEELNNAK